MNSVRMKGIRTKRANIAGWAALLMTILPSSKTALAAAPPTSFTYQGELIQAGEWVDGTMPMKFRLFTEPAGGTLLGTADQPAVTVQAGLFTTSLQYPVSIFNSGQALWLEVEVDGTVLTPRQLLSAAPYSLSTRGISVSPQNRVALGFTGPAESLLDVRGGGLIVHDDSGEGIALLSNEVRFDAVTGDTVYRYSDAADKHEFFTGLATVVEPRLVIDPEGKVGIGATSPAARLHVEGGSDTEPGSGGYAVLGPAAGKNISLDNNEIMARDSGAISPLFLNADGGTVVVGASTVPPGAALAVNGTIASTSGGVRFPDGSLQTAAPSWKETLAGDAYLPAGNAGVGTATPTAAVHVNRPLQETAIRLETTRSNSGPPASVEENAGSVAVVGGGAAWSSPQNALTSNNQWAVATLTEVEGGTDVNPSKDLLFSDFGFNLPASASIVSVQVQVEAHAESQWSWPTSGAAISIRAQVEGEAGFGAYELSSDTDSTGTATLNVSLTGSEVNSPSFAVRVRADLILYYYDCSWGVCDHYDCDDCDGTATVSIDHVKVKLLYHDASATLTAHNFSIGLPADSDVLMIGPGASPVAPSFGQGSLAITADGKVGINMIPLANHGAKLQVDGTIRCTNLLETSSRRFKRAVRPLANALQIVSKLQGVSYTWDEHHGGQPDIGFIAEEVGAVLPEIVDYETDGVTAIGMKYDRIGALNVEAIKELHALVQQQQAQITELQARLQTLKAHGPDRG